MAVPEEDLPADDGGQELQPVEPPGPPADAGSADARLRRHIVREAAVLLACALEPASGTARHVFGGCAAGFLRFTAQRLWSAGFPGAADPERMVAMCMRMQVRQRGGLCVCVHNQPTAGLLLGLRSAPAALGGQS